MLPVLAGTLLLLNESDGRNLQRLFVSGLTFGIGLLMKQPAVFFVLFGALYLLTNDLRRKRGWKRVVLRNLTFDLGAAVPFGLVCLFLWRAGVFDKFWFWTISYARQYGTLVPFSLGAKLFSKTASDVISSTWALWILAALGVIWGFWDKRMRGSAVFLAGFLAFSLVAFSAGFYFREHYYIFVLPAVSLFAGVAMSTVSDLANRRGNLVRLTPLLLSCAALGQPIVAARKFYFEFSPVEVSRMIYGANPFSESVRVAQYLHDHTEGSDTIAVLGSEPEIYFYSKRHSATGYIYTYGLMEPQSYARQMQEEMIRQIESGRPKYLIFTSVPTSWMRRPESDSMIFAWATDYIRTFYEIVGLVNILSPDHTDYYFDQLPNPMPELANYILICRRKS